MCLLSPCVRDKMYVELIVYTFIFLSRNFCIKLFTFNGVHLHLGICCKANQVGQLDRYLENKTCVEILCHQRKLGFYGVRGKEVDWIILSDRLQRVDVNCVTSSWHKIKAGYHKEQSWGHTCSYFSKMTSTKK